MVGRCAGCHYQHVVRVVGVQLALPNGGIRDLEVRMCGACAAALLDSLEPLEVQGKAPEVRRRSA
jgi:hypothetical protein